MGCSRNCINVVFCGLGSTSCSVGLRTGVGRPNPAPYHDPDPNPQPKRAKTGQTRGRAAVDVSDKIGIEDHDSEVRTTPSQLFKTNKTRIDRL